MAIKKFKVNASKQAKSIKSTKKSVKASSSLKVKPYVINKGQSGEYYGLKNAEDNQVLRSAPNNWKSERGAINWAKKKGYDVVDSACGKKSIKCGKVAASKKFTAKATKSIKAARNSKTMVELVLQGNYGYGWDDLVSYDNTPEGRKEMKDDLKTYQQEERGRASFRTVERRVANPDYKAPADRFRVTPYKLGFKYKDGDTVKFTDMEEAIEYAISQDKDVVLKDVVTGYNVQISNDTSFGMSGQERDNFNKRNIRNFRQVVGESETVESSMSAKKQFGVKASKSAKKRKAIKASGIQDDIVMYFNGDNVYQGSVYDLADAVENLCYDDEVNAKFQEWCNQFGDPFDFDGSPIDTARVFTDIIIHEAEEAPETENGGSQFYEDGNGILDFEIFYADEFSIDGAKSIKCSSSDNYNDLDEAMRFRVCNYYDTKFRDLAECKVFDDFDEAVDYAHECLGKGPTTIEDYYVGTVEIDPDEYWDNFDGEFWCTPELANFRDEVWKSMGIGASKSIKCSDADGIADEWEDIREIANQGSYEYDGYEDSDVLEYVDSFLQDASSGAWLNTDHVVYNGPDDWEVSAGLSPEAVESDFWFFLDDVDHDLYEDMLETELANPFDEDPINYTYNQNAINGNEFYIQLYPNNNQVSAPQIDFDEKYLTSEWLDRLVEIRKQYEESRKATYTEFQNGLGEFLANGITASTDIKAALNKKSDINDEQYNQALADEVADMLRADGFEDIEVSVAPEAISFFINDEVMFVQPTNMITPNMADIYDDCTELFNAVKEATTDKMWKLYDEENKAMRDAWEDPDIDDPDYATRAVTLSRKAKGKDISAAEETIDIDDLDYISGDGEQEDLGYGFDSNGDPIDESTVDELCRFANEILEKSNLAKIDKYVTIDEDSFDYYMASPWVTETFTIKFDITTDNLDMMSFVLPDAEWLYAYNDYFAERIDELNFHIYVKNGEVERVELVDHTVRDIQDGKYDVEKLEAHIAELAAPVAMDIYNDTTNI